MFKTYRTALTLFLQILLIRYFKTCDCLKMDSPPHPHLEPGLTYRCCCLYTKVGDKKHVGPTRIHTHINQSLSNGVSGGVKKSKSTQALKKGDKNLLCSQNLGCTGVLLLSDI